MSVATVSADSETQTRITADAATMESLGLYVSEPRSAQETDHRFPEPVLFVVNPEGELHLVDVANAPFAIPQTRPGLSCGRTAFCDRERLPDPGHPQMKQLQGIRACVFDAYGTIFDFASATARCSDIPEDKRAALTTLWRDKQLQYTWLRSLQGSYADFWQVTGEALDFALDSLGIATPALRKRLMNLYGTLSAFPEVADTLRQLRAAGFVTAILSNGSPAMLDAAVRGAGLHELLDAVLSADAVKVFKTHPRVYEYGLQELGLRAEQVSFQSSNAWDAFAASAFGMRVVWCNRYGQRRESLPGAPDHEVRSLAELPPLLAWPGDPGRDCAGT